MSVLICEAAVVSVQAEILKRNPTELISDAAVVLVRARKSYIVVENPAELICETCCVGSSH